MIFLFNNREELCGLIEFSELSSLTHILEINAFDLSTFEVPVEYVFGKLGKAQFFGFFLDPDNPQPDSFKIFKIREKSIGDTLVVSGIDKAESDLKHIKIIEDKRPNGNPAKILSVILEGTGYQVGVVSNLEQLSKQLYFYYLSPKEALAKLIEAFKCEFSITYTLNNNRITARHVNLYQKMGRDSGQQYEHGSDLLSVVYEEEADNVVTALIGRGKGEAIEDDEGLKTGGYSRRIDFKDVVWSKANGNPLDKPRGQNYLALENSAYALYQDGVAKHRFGVFIAEDIEDKNELINATYKELLSLSVPVTTYKAELVELYSGAWLGDSIAIFRDDAGIAFAARLYKIKVDKLDHNRSTVELGEYEAFKKLEVSSNSRLSMAMSDIKALAEGALKSADGKNTLFGDLSEPTNAREGDIWFKRNGNEDEMWQYRLIDGRLQWVYVTGDRYAKQIKEQVDSQFAEVTQQITEQQQAHDRTVAEILAQAESTEAIAQEAKRIGDQAKADAVNLVSQLSTAKTALQNSINDTKSQIATVSQALSTAKSDLQTQVNAADAKAVQAQTDVDGLKTKAETIKNDLNTAKSELQTQVNAADAKAVQAQRDITQAKSDLQSQAAQLNAQAAKQVELTKLTTNTKKLADGTLTSLNELTKTVDKATGDITSVTNRTKVVEDSLAGVKTNYTQLNQTVNAQTGQIDSINRKTADLENGISGVKERFESLQVGNKNYLPTSRVVNRGCTNFRYNETSQSWSMTVPTGATTGFGYGITFNTSGLNILLNGGETLFFGLMIKANKACSFNYDINNALSGSTSNDNDDRSKQAWSPSNKSLSANVWTRVWFSYTAKANVPITESNSNFGIVDNTEAVDIEIKEVIVAKSKVPVDYQSPDEDTAQQIAEYKRTADQNYSGLQSTISTLDGKVTQNKTEANQTATQLSNRLTSLETYKNAEGTRAQAYFEAAKTETAKQITAERSVIARDYTAKSTYQEDVTSIRRTISETKSELGSVTNRTKVVEDDLSGTKTKLEQVKATADTTSRKTAELQNGIDGVTERFDNLRVGGRNYINDYGFEKSHTFNSNTSAWKHERIADATARSGYHIKATCTQAGGGGFHKVLRDLRGAEWQGRTMTYAVDIKASKSVRMRLGVEAFKTGYKTLDVTTSWQRFVSTDIVNFKTWYSFPFYTDGIEWAVGDIIYIRDPQLEDGNVATTPHAAEEDFSNQIAEYKRTSEQNYSGLQSTVQTLDGKITQNKSEVNQTADAMKERLTSLETFKNAEGTRAQAYFEAAKTETAKQITAERTAITQNYVAKSTYTEDYNGTTRRLTATETVANRADTTANSAVTKATNAQNTADTAKANAATVTTRLATYQETNDRRVAALETNKISTDGTLTQLSNKIEQNAQQTRETISEIKSNLIIDGANSNLWIQSRTTGGFVTEALPANHVTGQRTCYKLTNNTEITFNIEPDFSDRLYRKVTFSAWVKYENVVQGNNNWNKFNCFKHVLFRKNSKTGNVSTTDFLTLAGFEGTSDWKRITYTYDYSTNTSYNQLKTSIKFNVEGVRSGMAWVTGIKIELGDKATPYSLATEDVTNEISNAKLDITKTADGLKLAATKTELTNAQNGLQSGINAAKSAAESAQAKANSNASTITKHSTQITALNNELSAKVSKTDYNTLTGRMTSAETTIQAQAGEISKRLTSTQVESAITAKGYQTASQVNATVTSKGYQTKSDVDSNINGRGYITSSSLQPYALATTVQNLVKETADSFNRTISTVRLEIPTNASMRNLILKSSDKWGPYVSTNNANSNWCPEICRITLDSDRGISVGKKLNLFVYISADNVTLDSSSNHRMAIQAAILKKDGTTLWHADAPFYGQWSQNLKAGNNYYVIKLTKEIKATAYENGATLIVQCRIDGANHVDFHHRAAMITTGDMFPDVWYPAPEDMATVVAFNKVSDAVDHHTQTLKDQEGRINTVLQTATTAYQLLQSGGSIYEDLKTVKGQIKQVRDANYATRIETLAGSWAVKNLTSGGQMLNQFNLLANGINHIDGRLTHITGDTLIDRGVIKSAMIGNSQIGTAHIGTIDASQANIINLNVNKLVGLDAAFIKAKIETAMIDWMKGKVISSSDEKMKIHLDTNRIEMNSNAAAIMRKQDGFPIEYINFTNATNTNGTRSSNINIGIDRSQNFANLSNSGDFSGIRIFNNFNSQNNLVDQVEVVGDNIIFSHATTNTSTSRGWIIRAFNDMHSPTIEPYFNSNTPNVGEWKKNTIIKSGDFWILSDNGKYISVASLLKMLNLNMAHLVNIVGRADVLKHMGDFDGHFAGTDLH